MKDKETIYIIGAGMFVWSTSKYKHMQAFHFISEPLWERIMEVELVAMITPS